MKKNKRRNGDCHLVCLQRWKLIDWGGGKEFLV